MAYRAILCDLGGVVVDLEADRLIHQASQLIGCTFDEVHQAVYDPDWLLPLEIGKITPEAYHARLCEKLKLPWTYPQFVRAWNNVLGERPAMTELLSSLRPKLNLVALTNTNVLHLKHIREAFGLSRVFHGWVASCEVGCRKPDASIYEAALKAVQLSAREVLYVDDRPEMIEGGRAAGIEAVRFESIDQLKRELASRGIL